MKHGRIPPRLRDSYEALRQTIRQTPEGAPEALLMRVLNRDDGISEVAFEKLMRMLESAGFITRRDGVAYPGGG